jgi:hypothetical protein
VTAIAGRLGLTEIATLGDLQVGASDKMTL